MQTGNCVVVIPIHKQAPSAYELISFEQCYKILHRHPIFIIAPDGLDLSEYEKMSPGCKAIRVAPSWQSSLLNYNKLKLSMFFYNLFKGFKFMLTYELDAFVFKDDVDYWCTKDYDYIGAPWFEGYGENPGNKLIGVGNSGFSLRKIDTIKKGINAIYYPDPTIFYRPYSKRYVRLLKGAHVRIASACAVFVNLFASENKSIQRAKRLDEDRAIVDIMAKKVAGFKMPSTEEAMHFSFEVKPEALYIMNGHKLPMGCHAWWRYNLAFWQPFIESFGYKLLSS